MRTVMLLTVENWVKGAYTRQGLGDAGPEYDLYTSGTVSVKDTREDAGRGEGFVSGGVAEGKKLQGLISSRRWR